MVHILYDWMCTTLSFTKWLVAKIQPVDFAGSWCSVTTLLIAKRNKPQVTILNKWVCLVFNSSLEKLISLYSFNLICCYSHMNKTESRVTIVSIIKFQIQQQNVLLLQLSVLIEKWVLPLKIFDCKYDNENFNKNKTYFICKGCIFFENIYSCSSC